MEVDFLFFGGSLKRLPSYDKKTNDLGRRAEVSSCSFALKSSPDGRYPELPQAVCERRFKSREIYEPFRK
jgi:hypothetical protein